MMITMSTRSNSLRNTVFSGDSFHTGRTASIVSHLKPFNVASIHTANVSSMIRKMSTRSDSFLTGDIPSDQFSHLKPFNVASIHIANVSNMCRKMSTRSDSLLTGFSPVTVFILGERPVWFPHPINQPIDVCVS